MASGTAKSKAKRSSASNFKTKSVINLPIRHNRILGKASSNAIEIFNRDIEKLKLCKPLVRKGRTSENNKRLENWDPTGIRRKIRSQLCMGMNQVTRSLEKDAARLVLLDEHCRPPMLTAHLVELAEVRNCPIVSFPHLSECAKKLFGLSCLVALAFKKTTSEDTESFNNIIATFTELCPINISQPTVPPPRNKPAKCTKPQNTGHVMETLDTAPSDTGHETGTLSSSGFIPLGGDESETSHDFIALGSTGGGGGGDRGNVKRPHASVKRGFGSEDFLGFNDYQPLHVNECVKNQNRKKKK